jgi:hypothetical protein
MSSALIAWQGFPLAVVLAAAILTTLFIASTLGTRARKRGARVEIGPLETMGSGLLGLLLAFNFSIAQTRFDARQAMLIREANAIGTAYLRCSVLSSEGRAPCRDGLRKYVALRKAAYDAYGARSRADVAKDLAEGERIQRDLWALVARATRDNPDPPNALLMSALNEVIDLDTDRRSSLRITVPPAVSVAIMLACVAWAALLGYSSGARKSRPLSAWVVVSLLVSIVFGVALDLDRPRHGLITTAAAERAMSDLSQSMEAAPSD